jgi:hypothetical protein
VCLRACTAAVVAVLAWLIVTTPAEAAAPANFYGVNVQAVFRGPLADWERNLSAMRSGGLQLARIDARWQNVEPRPPRRGVHLYTWAHYDRIVQMLASHGLRWLPIVDYSTRWAAATPGFKFSSVAPAHVRDFVAYARAFAARYGRGGSFWHSHPELPRLPVTEYEIWNEENSTIFWHEQQDAPERYADLFAAARFAIATVDPRARVIVGGLALVNPPQTMDEIDFLERMYLHRPELRGTLAGVALHPYQQSLSDTYMRLAKFRLALDRIDSPSVPIEITEVGWPTTAIPESQRAADLWTLARLLPYSDCNVDRFLPYTWVTSERNPADPEEWFGIWSRDGSPKPSGASYLAAVRLMRRAAASSPATPPVPICHPPAGAMSRKFVREAEAEFPTQGTS